MVAQCETMVRFPVHGKPLCFHRCLFFLQEHLPSHTHIPSPDLGFTWVITRARAGVKHVPVMAVGPAGGLTGHNRYVEMFAGSGCQQCPCVSPSPGLLRACSGPALGFKTEENKTLLRIYGFEGEPGGRGGGVTRIRESKRRRQKKEHTNP